MATYFFLIKDEYRCASCMCIYS